ncbi:hypothetical protein VTK56DRAFT_7971 [Thermocarpiscus australiensis]
MCPCILMSTSIFEGPSWTECRIRGPHLSRIWCPARLKAHGNPANSTKKGVLKLILKHILRRCLEPSIALPRQTTGCRAQGEINGTIFCPRRDGYPNVDVVPTPRTKTTSPRYLLLLRKRRGRFHQEIHHLPRLAQHRRVAAAKLPGGDISPRDLGHLHQHPLGLGRMGAVVGCDQIPARHVAPARPRTRARRLP